MDSVEHSHHGSKCWWTVLVSSLPHCTQATQRWPSQSRLPSSWGFLAPQLLPRTPLDLTEHTPFISEIPWLGASLWLILWGMICARVSDPRVERSLLAICSLVPAGVVERAGCRWQSQHARSSETLRNWDPIPSTQKQSRVHTGMWPGSWLSTRTSAKSHSDPQAHGEPRNHANSSQVSSGFRGTCT